MPSKHFSGRGILLPRQHDAEQVHRQLNVFQFRWSQFFETRFERIADLPLDIHRHANSTFSGQRLDARGNVHAIAIDISFTVHDVADMNSDSHLNAPVARNVVVAFGECALDLDCALRGFQGAVEFD
jgi:hypothetical protein